MNLRTLSMVLPPVYKEPKFVSSHRNPVCVRTCRKSTSKVLSSRPDLSWVWTTELTESHRIHVHKCATTYRSLIGTRKSIRTKPNYPVRPNRYFQTCLSSSWLVSLPAILRTTRTHEPTMGSNASTNLGGEANYGIRDL